MTPETKLLLDSLYAVCDSMEKACYSDVTMIPAWFIWGIIVLMVTAGIFETRAQAKEHKI